MYVRITLFLVLAAGSLPVFADADYVTRRKIEPARFDEFVGVLTTELRAGGRFEYVTVAERDRIDAALARMDRVLEGKRTIAELDEREKVAVFNAQEEINAILTKRDSERLVCQRRETVGSHRKETVCETYGEKMARSRGSRERANELNRRIQQCDADGRCRSG